MKELDHYKFKIVVIGDPAVGKTSLINSFSGKEFNIDYKPTLGMNIIKKEYKLPSGLVDLMLWDVVGQASFSVMQRNFFLNSDGGILVFDLTNFETLQNIRNWYERLVKFNRTDIPCILLGNKSDLDDSQKVKHALVDVTATMLALPYFETSAKTGDQVKLAFGSIIEALIV